MAVRFGDRGHCLLDALLARAVALTDEKASRYIIEARDLAMKSIGIVGCGAIGKTLVQAVGKNKLAVPIAGVTSRTERTAQNFLSAFEQPPGYLSLSDFIAASDLIVEAAGGAVVPALAERVFAVGKDLMVISIGALLDHPEIMEASRQERCRLYLPSGAIAGLDGIKSAAVGEIAHVTHTARKPPVGFGGRAVPRRAGIRRRPAGRDGNFFRLGA